MDALLLGLGALVLLVLLLPLLRGSPRGRMAARPIESRDEGDDAAQLALREIELDHAMGRLSDADYRELRQRYERQLGAPERGERAVASDDAAGTDRGGAGRASRHAPGDARAAVGVRAVTADLAEHADLDEQAEALVRQYRGMVVTCPVCGPRPEPDSRFCSSCGRYIHPCPQCGERVDELGARFCPSCGNDLA